LRDWLAGPVGRKADQAEPESAAERLDAARQRLKQTIEPADDDGATTER